MMQQPYPQQVCTLCADAGGVAQVQGAAHACSSACLDEHRLPEGVTQVAWVTD